MMSRPPIVGRAFLDVVGLGPSSRMRLPMPSAAGRAGTGGIRSTTSANATRMPWTIVSEPLMDALASARPSCRERLHEQVERRAARRLDQHDVAGVGRCVVNACAGRLTVGDRTIDARSQSGLAAPRRR